MGTASARAVGLRAPVTSFSKYQTDNNHRIYLKTFRGQIVGLLKAGSKRLLIKNKNGALRELETTCVLDFYVSERFQRSGHGWSLFKVMLRYEGTLPELIAYDRPSPKLLGFLRKHCGLSFPVPQSNNFVLFEKFFSVPRGTQTAAAQESARICSLFGEGFGESLRSSSADGARSPSLSLSEGSSSVCTGQGGHDVPLLPLSVPLSPRSARSPFRTRSLPACLNEREIEKWVGSTPASPLPTPSQRSVRGDLVCWIGTPSASESPRPGCGESLRSSSADGARSPSLSLSEGSSSVCTGQGGHDVPLLPLSVPLSPRSARSPFRTRSLPACLNEREIEKWVGSTPASPLPTPSQRSVGGDLVCWIGTPSASESPHPTSPQQPAREAWTGTPPSPLLPITPPQPATVTRLAEPRPNFPNQFYPGITLPSPPPSPPKSVTRPAGPGATFPNKFHRGSRKGGSAFVRGKGLGERRSRCTWDHCFPGSLSISTPPRKTGHKTSCPTHPSKAVLPSRRPSAVRLTALFTLGCPAYSVCLSIFLCVRCLGSRLVSHGGSMTTALRETARFVGRQAAALAGDVTVFTGETAHFVGRQAAALAGDVAVFTGETAHFVGRQAAALAGDVTVLTGETAHFVGRQAAALAGDVVVFTGETAHFVGRQAAALAGDVAVFTGETAHFVGRQAAALAGDVAVFTGETAHYVGRQAAALAGDLVVLLAEVALLERGDMQNLRGLRDRTPISPQDLFEKDGTVNQTVIPCQPVEIQQFAEAMGQSRSTTQVRQSGDKRAMQKGQKGKWWLLLLNL
uniref:N-acetyltransferase domain-containing protein n=1 Tax=Chromera velia CCMP2878 TaxID=1169474 RepID=A0A0G4HE28_9ALVE|eukprot:Cvel_6446.t1-p1 / transcript=Cvel_6446.t1 / gene=Cvel_6446 / organism=Chromera_velia_CCMP2878 / gene_product=Alpha-tubulin N-acetyltransferase, putative / transcript_product=Alpha-tubulin N-acetyltransferase, putative / location=Cvel_scaffold315:75028-79392(+) / protein_length=797 / sequence_SO=supercontig / SO=protein_coding / is_pseudo=false